MKITVLGGSPKGRKSVTMQYVEYMMHRRPDVEWDLRFPALRIRRMEKGEDAFHDVIEAVRSADAVLWAFPLYVHAACSQFHRFIELVEERDSAEAFAGKPAASITTSIHFFDHTAHDWIRSVSEDWGMGWTGSHSAHMRDLLSPGGKQALDGFLKTVLTAVAAGVPAIRQFPVNPAHGAPALPAATDFGSLLPPPAGQRTGKRIAMVTNGLSGRLGIMVDRFAASFDSDEVNIINLEEIRIAGGCMGCLKCGPANRCAWDGKDDIRPVYENTVEPADLYVIAAPVRGRWHSARMKAFIDRGFFHTHQSFLDGKQVAVLLDGSLAANPPLREYLKAYVEWQGATLAGIVASGDISTAEENPTVPEAGAAALETALDDLAARSITAMETGYAAARSFPGIAGIALFRDEIFSHLRMVFKGDHREYRRRGIYRTMIHKRPLKLLGYRLVGAVTSIPLIRNRMIANMRTFMLMPFQPTLKKVEPMILTSDAVSPPAAP